MGVAAEAVWGVCVWVAAAEGGRSGVFAFAWAGARALAPQVCVFQRVRVGGRACLLAKCGRERVKGPLRTKAFDFSVLAVAFDRQRF